MSAPDVLAVMDRCVEILHHNAWGEDREDLEEARAAVAELSTKAGGVARTLEMPTLVKQSAKNANAGFIDWRDWCALKGEVAALRAALARVQGGAA